MPLRRWRPLPDDRIRHGMRDNTTAQSSEIDMSARLRVRSGSRKSRNHVKKIRRILPN